MLTPEQQERFSRHLLLDGFDQDKVRAASFRVAGRGAAARWAARYLAASGCGRLVVDEPAWHPELRRLAPWTDLTGPTQRTISFSSDPDGSASEAAVQGAQAALDAIREVLAR
jgi:molybdopterin/thiamine biosynthesis adenylyltransferase